jgi:hypothetical protein
MVHSASLPCSSWSIRFLEVDPLRMITNAYHCRVALPLHMQTSSAMVGALRDGWRPCTAGVHGSHTHLHISLVRRSMLCRESHTCVQVNCRGAAAPAGSFFARSAISHSRSLSAQRAGQCRYSSADGSLTASSQPHSHLQQQQHMLQGGFRAGFGAKLVWAASAVAALLQYIQHLRWA